MWPGDSNWTILWNHDNPLCLIVLGPSSAFWWNPKNHSQPPSNTLCKPTPQPWPPIPRSFVPRSQESITEAFNLSAHPWCAAPPLCLGGSCLCTLGRAQKKGRLWAFPQQSTLGGLENNTICHALWGIWGFHSAQKFGDIFCNQRELHYLQRYNAIST